MIIAIPSDEKQLDSNVSISFGRAPFYLFYNTESNDAVFIENAAAMSQGGAGIKAAQFILENKAAILITPRCGENANMVFSEAEISIFKSINGSLKENIAAYISGKLSMLEEVHKGMHGHA